MNGPAFGVDPEDQVPRLERFRAEHPDIHVDISGDIPRLREWVARRGGEILAKRYDLQWLLDDLESMLEP